jgi:hypothetical protein
VYVNYPSFPGRSPHYGMSLIKLKDASGVEETIPHLFRKPPLLSFTAFHKYGLARIHHDYRLIFSFTGK